MDQTTDTSCLSYSVRYILLPMLDTHCLEEFMFLLNLVQGVLGLVCTTSGDISGIDSPVSYTHLTLPTIYSV